MTPIDWTAVVEERPLAVKQLERGWRSRGQRVQCTAAACARALAERDPDRIVLRTADRVLAAADLVEHASAVAASLAEIGIRPGDVVSFQLPNLPEAAVIDLAVCMLGAICNPIVPIYRALEVRSMLGHGRSRAIFVTSDRRGHDRIAMLEALRKELPGLHAVIGVPDGDRCDFSYEDLRARGAGRPLPAPGPRPDAVKLVMYTSGTTGEPKGVVHTHESIATLVEGCLRAWDLVAGDVMLMPSPVTHITGYACGLEMPMQCGTQTLLMERWDPGEAIRLIDRFGANACVGATPFLKELLDACVAAGTRLASLRVFACGGAAVPPPLIRAANAWLHGRAFRVYGSTETPLVTAGAPAAAPADVAAETDGRIEGYEVRIVDDAGVELPDGREGRLFVRGPAQFLGYVERSQTQEAFDADGYFDTGDVGIRTAGGYLTITGRTKDLIIRGGENLSAKEIEDAVHRHPHVREAAAVAMPHERLGETVCLFVVPAPGASLTLADIVEFLNAAGIAKQKLPEQLELVREFPRTASGKIRKDVLRQTIAEIVRARGP